MKLNNCFIYQIEYCTQCGEPTLEFKEGYCVDCCDQNQQELDNHNCSYDRWQEMTTEERDIEIKNAIKFESF